MIRKARFIITKDCFRNCSYCCNKYKSIMSKAITTQTLYAVKNYDEIMITGGEPLEDPKRTLKIIELIRLMNPTCKIYLYTARYSIELIPIIDKIDGVHFTLHESANTADVVGFNKMQILAGRFEGKSFRLYMHPGVKHRIPVKPLLWSRIESKPWLEEKDCKLPEGETLYILDAFKV